MIDPFDSGIWESPQLPHAGPMRWVSRASLSPDDRDVTVVATIASDHPFVRDGLLQRAALIEWMAQAAAAGSILKVNREAGTRRVKHGVLVAIREFTVHADIPAGSQIHLRAMHEKTFGALSRARFEVRSDGQLVAEARMTFHLTFE